MDRFEGRCWLDWWVNSSTHFGGIEVSVVITPIETGWDAHGQLIDDSEHETFAFLYDLDPVFTLRFQDGSTVQVTSPRSTTTGSRSPSTPGRPTGRSTIASICGR